MNTNNKENQHSQVKPLIEEISSQRKSFNQFTSNRSIKSNSNSFVNKKREQHKENIDIHTNSELLSKIFNDPNAYEDINQRSNRFLRVKTSTDNTNNKDSKNR